MEVRKEVKRVVKLWTENLGETLPLTARLLVARDPFQRGGCSATMGMLRRAETSCSWTDSTIFTAETRLLGSTVSLHGLEFTGPRPRAMHCQHMNLWQVSTGTTVDGNGGYSSEIRTQVCCRKSHPAQPSNNSPTLSAAATTCASSRCA